MKSYLVGGAVRDKLLGVQPHDRDWVVVGATDAMMIEKGFTPVGANFGVYLHPETREEYALATTVNTVDGKTVNYSGPDVTLEMDLSRRDLTVSAIAYDDEKDEFIGACGAVNDVSLKVLRAVSEDAFWHDPLRVLRLARMAARYPDFSVDMKTIAICQNVSAAGVLQHISPERVWKEISRGLMCAKPSVMFNVLRAIGALKELFPELDALWGVPQPEKHHPEIDTGVHVMLVVDKAAEMGCDLDVRYAALCHDLGKALTRADRLPSHPGHEALGLAPLKALSSRMTVPNDTVMYAKAVCEHHTKIHTVMQLRASTLVDLISTLDIRRRKKMMEVVLQACIADARGRTGLEDREYPQADYFRAACAGYLSADTAAAIKNSIPQRLLEDIRRCRISAVKQAIREHSQKEISD